jgi:hypothetical protein
MIRWAAMSAARLLLLAAVVVPAATSPPPVATGQDDQWDKYGLLVERNIFLRYRRRAVARAPSPRPTGPVVRDSDRDVILTGVGRRDGEYVAFFENTASEITVRARTGQAVGQGRIKAITLDAVEYERDGAVTRIQVGDALQGGRFVRETVAAAPPPATRPSGPSTSPTTMPQTAASQPAPSPGPAAPAGGDKDSDTADIVERMRQRRERELRR